MIPDASYYPSAKVRLSLRFEEFTRELVDRVPKKAVKQLKGVKVPRGTNSGLKVVSESVEGGGVRWVIKGANTAPRPTSPSASILAKTQIVQGIVPVTASLKRNNIHTADQLTITLRWEDFPIDPRVVRSVAVEFYLGTIPPEEFAMGGRGLLRANGEPYSMVPDEYTSPEDGQTYSNLRFQGWADKYSCSPLGDSPEASFDCSDNTRLLIDQEAPPNLRLDPKLPIEKAIAEYMAHFPQFEGFSVRYAPSENQGNVTIEAATKRGAWPGHLGPPASGGDMSVLDYFVQATMLLGHHARVVGPEIIIQPASTIWGGKQIKRAGNPYVGRKIGNVEFPRPAFVGGQNIETPTFEKNFAGRASKNFEVRSYDPARKSMIVGRYPQKKDKVISALPGGKEDDKWQVQTVRAGLSQETVSQMAKQAYEQLARAELTINTKTQDMASFGGDNRNPDLLALESGDSIDILIDLSEARSTAADVEASQQAANTGAAYLKKLGYDDDFCQQYAAARVNLGMPRTFYLREAQIDWKDDSGVEVSVNACNFIEVRLDPDVQ